MFIFGISLYVIYGWNFFTSLLDSIRTSWIYEWFSTLISPHEEIKEIKEIKNIKEIKEIEVSSKFRSMRNNNKSVKEIDSRSWRTSEGSVTETSEKITKNNRELIKQETSYDYKKLVFLLV